MGKSVQVFKNHGEIQKQKRTLRSFLGVCLHQGHHALHQSKERSGVGLQLPQQGVIQVFTVLQEPLVCLLQIVQQLFVDVSLPLS